MPAYARKSIIEDEYGARRAPGGVILCGHCGGNLADHADNPQGTLYVLYTDKKHLTGNTPHDVYCENCFRTYFSKAKMA